jgi:AcrR family transcriptional regulator
MRVKSEERRKEIVRVAAELFEANGYERTSMSMISERLGGSKQTLYNYFASKEELLHAVLEQDVRERAQEVVEQFQAEPNLRKGLTQICAAYLTHQLSPLTIANMRTIAGQPATSKLGADFYDKALHPAWELGAAALKALMKEGKLRRADPWVAAMHLKGLALRDMLECRLLGAMPEPRPEEIDAAAKSAADAFLRIYEK